MRRVPVRALGVLALGLAVPAMPLAAPSTHGRLRTAHYDLPDSPEGADIYLNGALKSGRQLVGERHEADSLTGAQAACANCHRHSGLGSQEGRIVIPPVTGRFLLHSSAGSREETELPYVPGARPDREPYTDETLARAIRDGVDSEGRTMSVLMPRYSLKGDDMAALIVHLRALDRRRLPGVSDTELHFATIITPDADPVKRRGMLDVIQQFVAARNNTQRLPSSQNMMNSGKTMSVKGMFKVTRRWVLHVWEPTGPKSTWTAQLQRLFAAQPVFAVLSGLGGSDWSPVQTFCEKAGVPCLFPNVDLPPANAELAFYSIYFSRGVLLEADLIDHELMRSDGAFGLEQVRQVYRQGDIGEGAAANLARTLRARGIRVSNRAIPAGAPIGAVAAALSDVAGNDGLVLWLRPSDLAVTGSPQVASPSGPVYISGLMGDVDANPLPAHLQGRAHVAYPFDLPESRRVRVDYAFGWFRIRNIPVVAAQVQANTYLACGLVSETLKHMVDTFVPDYLIERLEDTAEQRILTGYYPRLTLGPHQRFASKGGYVVHVDESVPRLIPDGAWMTP